MRQLPLRRRGRRSSDGPDTRNEQDVAGNPHLQSVEEAEAEVEGGDEDRRRSASNRRQLRADNLRDRLFSLTSLSGPEIEAREALEDTTSAPSPGKTVHEGPTVHHQHAPLSGEDLRGIFSGAPHFLLEKGTRPHWFPHIVFPWDESTRIQNLQDRKPLHHASYTLATLHAHLPAFLERRQTSTAAQDLVELESAKHPSFDIGVYEVPNMLSSRAKERGCVGFRHYMELPIAPKLKTDYDEPIPDISADLPNIDDRPYVCCQPGVRLSRAQLIKGGPPAWRRIGVRDCSTKQVAQRLEKLCDLREDMVFKAKSINLFDTESITELHKRLFSTFLFPPPREVQGDAFKHTSLRTQIDILVRVLAIKGAWVDFSKIEWRIRAGQILWECPPHRDGVTKDQYPTDSGVRIDAERQWLLIQLLLAAELVCRLDAAVKVGLIGRSKGISITQRDIYHINESRNDQVDWAIICCRRAFESMTIKYSHTGTREVHITVKEDRDPEKPQSRIRKMLKRGRPKEKTMQQQMKRSEMEWDCITTPRFFRKQLDGLIVFMDILQWPEAQGIKRALEQKFAAVESDPIAVARTLSMPLVTNDMIGDDLPVHRLSAYENSLTSHLVLLLAPSEEAPVLSSSCFGGWISRSWLTGFVLPGEAVNDMLISTLLENDRSALRVLGPVANLYGGFIYKGRSWWSKMCVVSRIVSCLEGSTTCMGWVASLVVPQDEQGKDLSDRWVEVELKIDMHDLTVPRIYKTTQVLLDSSPLGPGGELTPEQFSLPMDDADLHHIRQTSVEFNNITLAKSERDDKSRYLPFKALAYAFFTIKETPQSRPRKVLFPLSANSLFISSFPCLPPRGWAAHSARHNQDSKQSSTSSAQSDYHRHFQPLTPEDDGMYDWSPGPDSTSSGGGDPFITLQGQQPNSFRLPGHPLHTAFYPYTYIPISSLPSVTDFPPKRPESVNNPAPRPPPSPSRSQESGRPRRRHRQPLTYIIDARGSKHKEAFARAWCTAVYTDAVVSRVGRTCLACSIREARALDVSVVIRVGIVASGIN